jgi:hypothetical protein
MSRVTLTVVHRQESAATAIVDLSPDQPVRHETAGRVISGRVQLDRPLPLAKLVQQVLMRYGLGPAADSEQDCRPLAETELLPSSTERGSLRA